MCRIDKTRTEKISSKMANYIKESLLLGRNKRKKKKKKKLRTQKALKSTGMLVIFFIIYCPLLLHRQAPAITLN